MSRDSVSLIIVGKSGNGKSSTANSILGARVFSRQAGCVSEATKPTTGKRVYDSTSITVVDGLDISRAGEDVNFTDVEHSLSLCEGGMTALLITLKFGTRFSEDDVKMVETVKSIFGENILKDFGICVLAYGDNFKYAVEEEGESYSSVDEWFQEQTGKVQDLYQECGKRCVLFDNMTKNEKEKNEQIENLLRCVQDVTHQTKRRYTSKDYIRAAESRSVLEANKRFPLIKQETDALIQQIRDRMNLQDGKDKHQLNSFASKLEEHMCNVKKALGTKSNNMMYLETSINVLLAEIKSKLKQEETFSYLDETLEDKVKDLPFNTDSDEEMESFEDIKTTIDSEKDTVNKIEALMNSIDEAERELCRKYSKVILFLKNLQANMKNIEEKKIVEDKIKELESRHSTCNKCEAKCDTTRHSTKKRKLAEIECQPHSQFSKNLRQDTREMTFLLMGRSGNGKSSTGNTILGRQAFHVTSDTTTVPSKFTMNSSQQEGLKINIVDGPGIDFSENEGEGLETALNKIREALEVCQYKFSALLIVLQYGIPFNQHDVKMLNVLRGILGKDVLNKHGICVMTHAENYIFDTEGDTAALPIEEWYMTQEGEIGQLLKECNNRFVVLDNKHSVSQVIGRQVETLLSYVEPEMIYSENDFISAAGDLNELLKDSLIQTARHQSDKLIEESQSLLNKNDSDTFHTEMKPVLHDLIMLNEMVQNIAGDSVDFNHIENKLKAQIYEIESKAKLLELNKQKESNYHCDIKDKSDVRCSNKSFSTQMSDPLGACDDWVVVNTPTSSEAIQVGQFASKPTSQPVSCESKDQGKIENHSAPTTIKVYGFRDSKLGDLDIMGKRQCSKNAPEKWKSIFYFLNLFRTR